MKHLLLPLASLFIGLGLIATGIYKTKDHAVPSPPDSPPHHARTSADSHVTTAERMKRKKTEFISISSPHDENSNHLSGDANTSPAPSVAPLPATYNFYTKYPQCWRDPYDITGCDASIAAAFAATITNRDCQYNVDNYKPVYLQNQEMGKFSAFQTMACTYNYTSDFNCDGKKSNIAYPHRWMTNTKEELYTNGCIRSTRKDWMDPDLDGKCEELVSVATEGRATVTACGYSVTVSESKFIEVEDIPKIGKPDPAKVQKAIMLIKRAIFDNGPVMGIMDVHTDFYDFHGPGIYSKTSAKQNPVKKEAKVGVSASITGHTFMIVGWGTQDNVDYWIAENSWGYTYKDEKGRSATSLIRIKMDDSTEFERGLEAHVIFPSKWAIHTNE